MGVYGITLHGSGKVCIMIKPRFIGPQIREGVAGMEVSQMTCLHSDHHHQPQREKPALSLNKRPQSCPVSLSWPSTDSHRCCGGFVDKLVTCSWVRWQTNPLPYPHLHHFL